MRCVARLNRQCGAVITGCGDVRRKRYERYGSVWQARYAEVNCASRSCTTRAALSDPGPLPYGRMKHNWHGIPSGLLLKCSILVWRILMDYCESATALDAT